MLLLRVATTAAWLLTTQVTDSAEPSGDVPTDRISTSPGTKGLSLSWHDAEDRLDGWIEPVQLKAGHPLQVVLRVGSFEGATFDGPILFTLRAPGQQNGQTVTAKKGEVNWRAEFTPEDEGDYTLDVAFRSTRMKVVHATVPVISSFPLRPSQIALIAVILAGLVVALLQMRRLLRRGSAPPPTPAS